MANVVWKAGASVPTSIVITSGTNIPSGMVGTYTQSGTFNTYPCYTNGTYWIFWDTGYTDWSLDTTKTNSDDNSWYDGTAQSTLASITGANWTDPTNTYDLTGHYTYNAGGQDTTLDTIGNWFQANGTTPLGRMPNTTETLTFPGTTAPGSNFGTSHTFYGLDLTTFSGTWSFVNISNVTLTGTLTMDKGIFNGTTATAIISGGGTNNISITSGATITGGSFNGGNVGTNATISGGYFQGTNIGSGATITGGSFNDNNIIGSNATITTTGITFNNALTSISDGLIVNGTTLIPVAITGYGSITFNGSAGMASGQTCTATSIIWNSTASGTQTFACSDIECNSNIHLSGTNIIHADNTSVMIYVGNTEIELDKIKMPSKGMITIG